MAQLGIPQVQGLENQPGNELQQCHQGWQIGSGALRVLAIVLIMLSGVRWRLSLPFAGLLGRFLCDLKSPSRITLHNAPAAYLLQALAQGKYA